jgi:hypothetical protein
LATDEDRSSAHCERRRNVIPGPDATVGVDLGLIAYRSDDLRQGLGRADRRTRSPPAVRGDNDACCASVDAASSARSTPFTTTGSPLNSCSQPIVSKLIEGSPGDAGWSRSDLLSGRQVGEPVLGWSRRRGVRAGGKIGRALGRRASRRTRYR